MEGDDEISDLANTFRLYNKIIAEQKSELENISLTDALTNVANRRALDIRLSYDLKVSERNNSTVAILLVDIDCFKLYNDNYGHVAGDLCLKKIAGVLDNSLAVSYTHLDVYKRQLLE